MANFENIRKLNVGRVLSNGEKVRVGTLAQNHQGVFFAYHSDYLKDYGNLSPFTLKADTTLQLAPKAPHFGLHGVFGDCLPDGWGLLLQDRFFRQQGILFQQITAMDRLAFVGKSAIGALYFEPSQEWQVTENIDYATLGLQAQAVFDGETTEILTALTQAGSSGGARPKAQLFMPKGQTEICRSLAQQGDEAWIVKFTSKNLPFAHQESLLEAVYLQLAENAELQPPKWQLLNAPKQSGAEKWLAIKRFDWLENGGRLHQHSIAGLLDADFRLPSLDYEDLIKASRLLCQSSAVGELQFRRAIFNLFACNQDDHAKNWAFLQEDNGSWRPAPFYDVTFSPQQFNEHATSFCGYGKNPPQKALQKLAARAGISWGKVENIIEQTQEIIAMFPVIAADFGVRKNTITEVQNVLNKIYKNWSES